MNYLLIDTSGKNLTVAVKANGKLNISYDFNCGVNHSVKIMPEIERVICESGISLKDLTFIAVVVGAGSFTGIRIGVSTAKALCFANGLPCLALTSFDAIAYNKEKGKSLALINAGHGSFYACGYQDKKVVLDPCFISSQEVTELSKEYSLISGEEIEGLKTEVLSIKEGIVKACEENYQNAVKDLDKIEPLYIRKSQAEEGR